MAEAESKIPGGMTCRDCKNFTPKCEWFLSLSGDERECDWFPSKFAPKPGPAKPSEAS